MSDADSEQVIAESGAVVTVGTFDGVHRGHQDVLARDLGRLVGSAAHLVALRRERSGPFAVDDAASLEQLLGGQAPVLPPLRALDSMPQERIDEEAIGRIVRGIDVPAGTAGEWGALVGDNGALVAVAERRGDRWQPRVVMREAD